MKYAIALIAVSVLLAACDNHRWQTRDVTGLLPELDFALSRADGAVLTAEGLHDDYVLLFFGFTSCPDVCPTTLMRLSKLMQQMPEPMQHRVRVVFVSVDPDRDNPEKLLAYTRHFNEDFIAATGTHAQLRQMARRYRTTFSYGEPDEKGDYEVSHSSGIYVFDDKGDARLLFRPDDSIQEMRADLMQLMR